MADFTSLALNLNTGTTPATPGTPVWTAVGAAGSGTGVELRWSDASTAGAIASASWPFMTRPAATQVVPFLYAFSADTTSLGSLGTSSNTPVTFANSNFMHSRWNWDNTGTFASAPIFTAYPSTAHGAISRGDGSVLGGHATDTGGTARSYLKAAMFGRVTSAGAPAAAVGSAPVVTDGATGAVSPTAGANWSVYQGLQGDNDWLAFPSTPAAVTADQLNTMFALFTGPNQTPGTLLFDLTFKYSYA